MKEYGEQIAKNGYEVIPIRPGEKRPYGKEWEKYDGSPKGARSWIRSGKGAFGVGIKSKHAPAVDLDIRDPAVVDRLKKFVFELVGEGMERVGMPPKTLLAYQTDEPFPKVDTGFWIDDEGRTVKVEILADGQQYVAAHIHPDTGQPYQWLGGKSVLRVKRSSLPILRQYHAEAIKAEAIRVFEEMGWQRKTNALRRLAGNSAGSVDPDDPFANISLKTDISDEELHAKLLLVPDCEDYETWFHVGMALWHQYDGAQLGLDMWHEWSAPANNYDAGALDRKWTTFDHESKNRKAITARFIIKLAAEEQKRVATEELANIRDRLQEVETLDQLTKVCDDIKKIAFTAPVREMLIGSVKERFKKVTGTMPRIGIVREMIRYENPEMRHVPNWLRHYVFVQLDSMFHNMASGVSISREAFDATYSRMLLSREDVLAGESTPQHSPGHVALNTFQIPVVFNRMYMPGLEPLFTINGIDYVNTYTDRGLPELPSELSSVDWDAINTILYHFEHLFRHERDRRILLDFLTYIIQNPGKRINWMLFLQGAEGDGKSFIDRLLKAVCGIENAAMISGNKLEEKYNPWAEGSLVCFIEDIRLHGANRFDAINALKPMLTNDTVSIRRMNTNTYEVINTVSYIGTANLKDAMPVGQEDSRIFPMYSRFQSREAVLAFEAANPDYYDRLHAALRRAGGLRKWFLEREISADFNPKKRAPISRDRAEMVALNRSDEQEALWDTLEDSQRPDYCELLLDSALVDDEFMGKGVHLPNTKALSRLLSTEGFTFLGRYKIGGSKRRFWSRKPTAWSDDEVVRGNEIREYLDPDGL
jgi:hypothetical protein